MVGSQFNYGLTLGPRVLGSWGVSCSLGTFRAPAPRAVGPPGTAPPPTRVTQPLGAPVSSDNDSQHHSSGFRLWALTLHGFLPSRP